MKKRLLGFGLAAAMLLTLFAGTVLGAESEDDGGGIPVREDRFAVFKKSGEELEKQLLAQLDVGDGIVLMESRDRARVGSTLFYMDTDANGTGWYYSAANGTLYLNGYAGGNIVTQGDLLIECSGTNTITAAENTEGEGQSGILAGADLDVLITEGLTTIYGGKGSTLGGDAILCSGNVNILSIGSGRLEAYGGTGGGRFYEEERGVGGSGVYCVGDLTCNGFSEEPLRFNGGYSKSDIGGNGLYSAGKAEIDGRIIARGGATDSVCTDPNTNTAYELCGGSGIMSVETVISTDPDFESSICGGAGKPGGPGVYVLSNCSFDLVRCTIAAGVSYKYEELPIFNDQMKESSNYLDHFTVSPHVTITEREGSEIYLSLKTYTLTLHGEGGTDSNGKEKVTLRNPYPMAYDLVNYGFSRSGYEQVSWLEKESAQELPLIGSVKPEKDMDLYASWQVTKAGDILLNSLNFTFSDGSRHKISSADTNIPEKIQTGNGTLLGWCSEMIPTQKDSVSMELTGTWYLGGDQIKSNPFIVTKFYAQDAGVGQFAVFDAGVGTVIHGGKALVYGTSSDEENLAITAPGGDRLNTLPGLEFAGWSVSQQADTVDYNPGDKIVLKPGEVQVLYACWIDAPLVALVETGLKIGWNKVDNTMVVEAAAAWTDGGAFLVTALYENGQMVDVSMKPVTGEDPMKVPFSLENGMKPECRVFLLDGDNNPVRKAAQYNMGDLIP